MPRAEKHTTSNRNAFYSALDFCMEVCGEKIADNGEDSYLYMISPQGAIAGVFDGCGGAGARKYENYRNKTGAFMASRIAAGAARDWFLTGNAAEDPEGFQRKAEEYLALCKEIGGGASALKSSLSKDFPTTAAVVVTALGADQLNALCLWAGDSRCYLLDETGLKQLTDDDLDGLDPMENLTSDGVLTNVISASKHFTVHQRAIGLRRPGFLFAATDGCFGYLSTPMEFEYLLLKTLFEASSVEQWERNIDALLCGIAGDDYTLSGLSFGFGSLENMKALLQDRYRMLTETYIRGLRDKSYEEKVALWQRYRTDYSRFLRGN